MANSSWCRIMWFVAVLAFAAMPGVTSTAALAQLCTTGDQFADQVQLLKTFDFANNGGMPYQPPQSLGSLKSLMTATPPPGNYLLKLYGKYHDDMAAAFNAAPPYLKTALCSLEKQVINGALSPGVFIDEEDQAPFAWSFWEVSTQDGYTQQQGSGVGRYIAVGAKTWRIRQGLNLAGLETLILTRLFGDNARGALFGTPKVTPAVSETPGTDANSPTDMALMAILAREVGLMIYHDFVDATPKSSPLPTICPGTTTFQSISWTSFTGPLSVGRIQKLGEETNITETKWNDNYTSLSTIRQYVNQLPPAHFNDSVSDLVAIYTGSNRTSTLNPEWADALAIATPYDDFAETFRLLALHDSVAPSNTPPLGDIMIPVPPTAKTGPKLISNLDKKDSLLGQKVACIRSNLPPNPTVWSMP